MTLREWLISLFRRPQPAPPPPPPPSPPGDEARQLLNLHNQQRARAGVSHLLIAPVLLQVAQVHASDMARREQLSHKSSDGSLPEDRTLRAGYTGPVGENIGAGQRDAQEIMAGWMGSSGHRANLLSGQWRDCGFGVATSAQRHRYWCAVYGGPYGLAVSLSVEEAAPEDYPDVR